jgi:hypothetical protein
MGGSERGECPCTSPLACQLQQHPDYDHYRELARARMFRYLMGTMAPTVHPAIIAALTNVNKSEPTCICPICEREVAFFPTLNQLVPHILTVIDGREVPCPGGNDA